METSWLLDEDVVVGILVAVREVAEEVRVVPPGVRWARRLEGEQSLDHRLDRVLHSERERHPHNAPSAGEDSIACLGPGGGGWSWGGTRGGVDEESKREPEEVESKVEW